LRHARRRGLNGWFEHIIAAGAVEQPKPAPDIYLTRRRCSNPAEACLAIETRLPCPLGPCRRHDVVQSRQSSVAMPPKRKRISW